MSDNAATFNEAPSSSGREVQGFVLRIIAMVAFAHLLNDMMQSVLPASYPLLKSQFSLNFTQIGWISLVYQLTASLLQPWIGLYTDKHPKPYLLPVGMIVTFFGIGLLSIAANFPMLLMVSLIGVGSSTFHPEASRVARLAAGGRFGTAQSSFQVGGNTGSALGPIMAAVLVIPHGRLAIAWLMLAALLAIWLLFRVSRWRLHCAPQQVTADRGHVPPQLNRRQIFRAMAVIGILMFAKFVYIAAFTNYFTFYLIERFHLPVRVSQLYLFAFLAGVALGTFAGGPALNRVGAEFLLHVIVERAEEAAASSSESWNKTG